jgi:hypothetical protein
MNKIKVLALIMIVAASLSACTKTDTGNTYQTTETSSSSSQATSTTSTTTAVDKYGSLQELVDTYGLPINLWRIEGVTLTKFELSEDSAKREWMSNTDQQVQENLSWSIDGDHITISGEWNETFSLNSGNWRAISEKDGKEYIVIIYNKDGDVIFRSPDA